MFGYIFYLVVPRYVCCLTFKDFMNAMNVMKLNAKLKGISKDYFLCFVLKSEMFVRRRKIEWYCW